MPSSTPLPEFVANVGKSLKLIDKTRYEKEGQQKDMDIAAVIEASKHDQDSVILLTSEEFLEEEIICVT